MKIAKYVAKKPDANGHVHFTNEENDTWHILYERQSEVVKGRACDEFIAGLKLLNMPTDRVPQCYEISEKLQKATGWAVEPVAKIIPLSTFFGLLADKKFPAATFIRRRDEIDYLKEPDIFHEFFGHCPLLTSPAYADFMQRYGRIALEANDHVRSILGRLFWFTIEFGLVNTQAGTRIYGGGILSSFAETLYALESKKPVRTDFEVSRVMGTDYRYDQIQTQYFVLNQIDDLFQIMESDLVGLATEIANKMGPGKDFVTC